VMLAGANCLIPVPNAIECIVQIAHHCSHVLVWSVTRDCVVAAPTMNAHVVIVETPAVIVALDHVIHADSSAIIAQEIVMQQTLARIATKLFAMIAGINLEIKSSFFAVVLAVGVDVMDVS